MKFPIKAPVLVPKPKPIPPIRTAGDLLRTVRTQAGLTQHELAEIVGVARSVLNRAEMGHVPCKVQMLVKACEAAGLPLLVEVGEGEKKIVFRVDVK